ncbi:nucleoside diphosphate kinase regulator [Sinorhizobium meliloti]|nr:nucleoside diphosphate kinase regulator [Sinorhizobium meliloti]
MIAETDHQRLNRLALAAADRLPEISDGLLLELERARVVSDAAVLGNVVRMGSMVEYETDTADGRTVTLVFPRTPTSPKERIRPDPSELPFSACPPVRRWAGRDGMIGSTS